ncbi:hypothetical protein CEXT_241661 [Caerostris extrusa]|uniref:Uncharacterized protein n=1 Tax=Caerostris extrusa TaxID=172846 RepID=A0AAV4NP99_CAEEX|nr:hypothetical protein CEXT_241661 [Caerostris extrusa]
MNQRQNRKREKKKEEKKNSFRRSGLERSSNSMPLQMKAPRLREFSSEFGARQGDGLLAMLFTLALHITIEPILQREAQSSIDPAKSAHMLIFLWSFKETIFEGKL